MVEVDPAHRGEKASADVAARVAAGPDLGPFEKDIVEALLGFGEDAEERGSMSRAVLWEASPHGPIVANLRVLVCEPSASSAREEVASIVKTLSAASATDLDGQNGCHR